MIFCKISEEDNTSIISINPVTFIVTGLHEDRAKRIQAHLVLLRFADIAFFFKQIEGLWQPCIKQAYWHQFSNSICSHPFSVSHFGNSQYFKSFHYYYICYDDL